MDYLQTQGAPFKGNIVSLLSQLMAHPEAFPRSAPPPFAVIDAVSSQVMQQCDRERKKSSVFIKPQLQALVQMCVLAERSKRMIQSNEPPPAPLDVRTATTTTGFMFGSTTRLRTPVKRFHAHSAKDLTLLQQLVDVYDMATCLILNARLPDHLTSTVAAHCASSTT